MAGSGQAHRALELHEEARRLCLIARSVNFPVSCEPVITRLQLSAVALSRDPGPLRNTILHKTGNEHDYTLKPAKSGPLEMPARQRAGDG